MQENRVQYELGGVVHAPRVALRLAELRPGDVRRPLRVALRLFELLPEPAPRLGRGGRQALGVGLGGFMAGSGEERLGFRARGKQADPQLLLLLRDELKQRQRNAGWHVSLSFCDSSAEPAAPLVAAVPSPPPRVYNQNKTRRG